MIRHFYKRKKKNGDFLFLDDDAFPKHRVKETKLLKGDNFISLKGGP